MGLVGGARHCERCSGRAQFVVLAQPRDAPDYTRLLVEHEPEQLRERDLGAVDARAVGCAAAAERVAERARRRPRRARGARGRRRSRREVFSDGARVELARLDRRAARRG